MLLRGDDLESRFRGILALLALAAILSAASQGCGASQRKQHERLNWITYTADPSYEMTVDACDDLRDYVVARQGSTQEEDRQLWSRINDVCDRAVASFEILRGTQLTARQAIDQGVEGAASEAVAQALSLWRQLQALVDGITVLEARTAGGSDE